MADRSSWSHYATVTTNTAKISGTSTEIVGYLDLSELDATFFSNAKADGSDIVIVPSGETTDANKLARELVGFSTSTNTGQLFFGPITVTSASSTSWDVWVGNASATETADPATVWGDYKAVWHLDEDPSGSAPQMIDSTGNGNDGTSSGGMSSGNLVTGQMGDAIDFDGSSDHINVGMRSFGTELALYSFSFWYTLNGVPSGLEMPIGNFNNGNTTAIQFYFHSDGYVVVFIRDENNNSTSRHTNENSTYFDGNWHHFCVVVDTVNNDKRVYFDGVEEPYSSTGNNAGTSFATFDYDLVIGARNLRGTVREYFSGELDEFRIRTGNPTEDEIKTEYAIQNDTSTFWTYGSTQSTGEPPTTPEQNALFFGGGA